MVEVLLFLSRSLPLLSLPPYLSLSLSLPPSLPPSSLPPSSSLSICLSTRFPSYLVRMHACKYACMHVCRYACMQHIGTYVNT